MHNGAWAEQQLCAWDPNVRLSPLVVLTVPHSAQLTCNCMLVHCLQENAKLHYGSPEEFTLTVPQFSIKPGDVVAVIGRVGCGERVV